MKCGISKQNLFIKEKEQQIIWQIEPIMENRRIIIVNWMVEVINDSTFFTSQQHENFLHLSVSVFDRFINKNNVIPRNLQLISIIAMYEVGKYFKSDKTIEDYIYITNDSYIKEEFLKYQKIVSAFFHHNFCFVTPIDFIYTSDIVMKNSVDYILNLSLVHKETKNYLPSFVAIATLYFIYNLYQRYWPEASFPYKSKELEIFIPIIQSWINKIERTSPILQKFYSEERGYISYYLQIINSTFEQYQNLLKQFSSIKQSNITKNLPILEVWVENIKEYKKTLQLAGEGNYIFLRSTDVKGKD